MDKVLLKLLKYGFKYITIHHGIPIIDQREKEIVCAIQDFDLFLNNGLISVYSQCSMCGKHIYYAVEPRAKLLFPLYRCPHPYSEIRNTYGETSIAEYLLLRQRTYIMLAHKYSKLSVIPKCVMKYIIHEFLQEF